jgi:Spy/CpxP family protein refolding chaperone
VAQGWGAPKHGDEDLLSWYRERNVFVFLELNQSRKGASMLKRVLSCMVAAGFIMSVSAAMGQATTNAIPNAAPVQKDEISMRLAHLSKALNLADDQKAKIKDIMVSSRDKVMKVRADAKAKQSEMSSDTNAVAATKMDVPAEVKKIRVDEMEQIKAVLTPEQLAKLAEMRQKQKGKAHPAE